ncbi:hypothetical protein MHM88_22940, partial [Epibacterium sp. MM17-32]|uniref:hypothetical protein n=1 Tax=Epibacterium sp. MM17-32 TaxID=2917734 RepID=UPI001EF53F25
WCPGAESNHRHEDFQSGTNAAKLNGCGKPQCQTHYGKSNAYKAFVKPKTGADKAKNTRSAMSRFAKDGHKRVCRCLGYALTLATPKAWVDLSVILTVRLSKAERAGLAYAALISMDADDAHDVASLALFGTSRGGSQ